MGHSRWWHVAVLGTAIVLPALVALQQPETWRTVGVVGVNLLFVIVWFAFGRLTLSDKAVAARRGATVFLVVVVLFAGVGTALHPSMATVQCLAFPLVWCLLPRLRDAVFGSIALAAATGIGIYLSTGDGIQAIIIEGLSLVFAIAFGVWISSIADQSETRGRLLEELRAAQEQLSVLNRDAGAFGERERLAREIHDTIAQDLTGLVLTAQRGLRELRGGNARAAETQLEVLEENARNALAETRALVASGAAVGVDIGGLATALGRLGERFQRETGIVVHVVADEAASLDRDGEVVLLRCAQEALANVRKHSAAASTTLTLAVHESEISLSIADDGRGFDAGAHSVGFGLDGMRERLAFVRGALVVIAAPGGGTTLIASVPTSREVGA